MTAEKKSQTPTVFILAGRESSCFECGRELSKGDFLYLEDDKGLCLSCADMDHLLFLPAGDAALTRRARKLSRLSAVVLKWSRARKRYERQGILVEEEGLQKAEEECLKDEELREARRIRESLRREQLDEEYKMEFTKTILNIFPGCPRKEAESIASHACLKYSGRIGRSAAAKRFERDAVNFAVIAHIRHTCTDYDDLLMKGWDRQNARYEVQSKLESVLDDWSG